MTVPPPPALMTDLYQLTMLAGYFAEQMHEQPATFDLFFRTAPFKGSYAVFAGLDPVLDYLESLQFKEQELSYLEQLGIFSAPFLDFLADFRFRGQITAVREGEVVFPHEPLVTVEGTLAEAQFVETALLNIINFQTLVATKAARLSLAAGGSEVLEFGLRRAQGPDGALSVARAAAIGGIRSTSNVWAGQTFDLPVKGTHAHSWVMAFPDELSAFRAYARSFPDSCVLLIDTYDTLNSGLPHALTVARELREKGHELLGVRLDSGDLAYLSKATRRAFDEAGFPEVKVVASNDLDENLIDSIRHEGGRIDIYGVGTRLATCYGEGGGALGGVYKLVRIADEPRMKITSDLDKATLPERKQLLRLQRPNGRFEIDLMTLPGEQLDASSLIQDPTASERHRLFPTDLEAVNLRQVVMRDGQRLVPPSSLNALSDYCAQRLQQMPEGSLRLVNPHRYKVSISPELARLRSNIIARHETLPPHET